MVFYAESLTALIPPQLEAIVTRDSCSFDDDCADAADEDDAGNKGSRRWRLSYVWQRCVGYAWSPHRRSSGSFACQPSPTPPIIVITFFFSLFILFNWIKFDYVQRGWKVGNQRKHFSVFSDPFTFSTLNGFEIKRDNKTTSLYYLRI